MRGQTNIRGDVFDRAASVNSGFMRPVEMGPIGFCRRSTGPMRVGSCPWLMVAALALSATIGVRRASAWTLTHTLVSPAVSAGAQFGAAVALAGKIVVVGAPHDGIGAADAGAAYVFDAESGVLLFILRKRTPAAGDRFGTAVAVAGSEILVGAPGNDSGQTDAGAAYLFNAESGALVRGFGNPTPGVGDAFGSSVAFVGTRVLIGAPLDDLGATDAGVAHLFTTSITSPTKTFVNPSPSANEQFGWSVASLLPVGSKPQVLIGAPGGSGAVYRIDASTGEIGLVYPPPTPSSPGSRFGAAVAGVGSATSSTVLIGAPLWGVADNGRAYRCSLRSGRLSCRVSAGTAGGDRMGFAVAIRSGASDFESIYLMGAPGRDADTGAGDPGFLNPSPDPGDQFGYAVSGEGRRVVIGAPFDDTRSSDAGAVYLFENLCGNGTVDQGEGCDEATRNGRQSSCCNEVCQPYSSGFNCDDDCSRGQCDGQGICVRAAPRCGDFIICMRAGEVCEATFGCSSGSVCDETCTACVPDGTTSTSTTSTTSSTTTTGPTTTTTGPPTTTTTTTPSTTTTTRGSTTTTTTTTSTTTTAPSSTTTTRMSTTTTTTTTSTTTTAASTTTTTRMSTTTTTTTSTTTSTTTTRVSTTTTTTTATTTTTTRPPATASTTTTTTTALPTTTTLALPSDVSSLLDDLSVAVPNAATAGDKKGRRLAKKVDKLKRKAGKKIERALATDGERRERLYRKARKYLEKLLKLVRKADAKGTLGVPLGPIEDAIAVLLEALAGGTTTTTAVTATTTSTTAQPPGTCGDGRLDPGEECDPLGGDYCLPPGACNSRTCRCEYPGLPFIRWLTPPPAMIGPAQRFPLAIQFSSTGGRCTGRVSQAEGTIGAFGLGTAPLYLLEAFDLTPGDGRFQGSPQTFNFQAVRNTECAAAGPYRMVSQLYLADARGQFSVGPFAAPVAATELKRLPPALELTSPAFGFGEESTSTKEVFLFGFARTPVPPFDVDVCSRCGDGFTWSAAKNAPWIRLSSSGGSVGGGDCARVEIGVDTLALPATSATHVGTATFTIPGSTQMPINVRVELDLTGGIAVQPVPPLPATIGTRQSIDFALDVRGQFEAVDIVPYACSSDPEFGTFDDCSEESIVRVEPEETTGGPGRFNFRLSRGADCSETGSVRVWANVVIHEELEDFSGDVDLGTIRLAPSTAVPVSFGSEPDDFNAFPGQTPATQELFFDVGCGSEPRRWTATVDQSWVHVTPTSGTAPNDDSVIVSVDPRASISSSPSTAKLFLTPSDSPVDRMEVPIRFNVRNDIAIQWRSQPPPNFGVGDSFTLAFAISKVGNAVNGDVFGRVLGCRDGISLSECVDVGSDFEADFEGPPGVFQVRFTREPDCLDPGRLYFVVLASYVTGENILGEFIGPRSGTTMLEAPAVRPTHVSAQRSIDDRLVFNMYGAVVPAPQYIDVHAGCDVTKSAPWSTATSTPWIRVTAEGPDKARVTVDPAGLDPNQGPFIGKIMVNSPGNERKEIEVVLNIAC